MFNELSGLCAFDIKNFFIDNTHDQKAISVLIQYTLDRVGSL